MRNELNNRDQLDDFSRRIRQELENHRMLVDEDGWSGIERRMKSKSRKAGWWVAGSVAAALLVFLFFYPYNEMKQQEDADQQIVRLEYGKEAGTPNPEDQLIVQELTNEGDKMIEPVAVAHPRTLSNKVVLPSNESEGTPGAYEDTAEQENNDGLQDATDQYKELKVQVLQEKKDVGRPITDEIDEQLFWSKEAEKAVAPTKKNDKWLLATLIGSGGGISNGNPSMDYAMDSPLPPFLTENQPPFLIEYPSFLPGSEASLDDLLDKRYAPPLSVGLMVRKNFNRTIGVESGLVYTYLSTSFGSWRESQLNLHYLGVPVNLVVYLWNDPQWGIYLTAGGMVEKGLRSVYKQSITTSGSMKETYRRTSIPGMQWSLNAATGVSYRFYENWSLYVEPRVSYYFDNHQPTSIRTNQSTVFGLQAGFRYGF